MKSEANYSIRDLEKLSGIKAHTLRIWEKRYSLFAPARSDTNIRSYSNDELKKILNISLLNKNGYKISLIAAMSDSEIAEKISAINLVRTENDDLFDNLIIGMIDMNESSYERIFSSCILKMGFEKTILKVIFPFLDRIGIMWQTGSINPAQEHFMSNIVRQKIIVAIDSIPKAEDGKKMPSAVLFLPENEWHEISLLFYNYALRIRGFRTIYLGQSVPMSDMERIIEIVKPDFLVSVITTSFSKKEISRFIAAISEFQGIKRILLSGRAVFEHMKLIPKKISVFQNLEELSRQISK